MGFCEMLIEIEHGCIFLGFGFEHARSAQDPICNGVRAQRRRAWIRAQRKTEDTFVFNCATLYLDTVPDFFLVSNLLSLLCFGLVSVPI